MCPNTNVTAMRYLAIAITVTICLTAPATHAETLWGESVAFGDNKSMHHAVFPGVGNTIVAATNIFRYNNGGDLWQSTDGGETWHEREIEVAIINAIEFVSSMEDRWYETGNETHTSRNVTGWAIGGREQIGIAMYIGKTTDAGATWTDYSDEFRDSLERGSTALYGLAVIDTSTIYVSSRDQVYMTNTGGQTWQQRGDIAALMPDHRARLRDTLQFRAAEPDGSRIFGFVSSSDSLFVTDDGGLRWERIDPPWNDEDRDLNLVQLRFFDATSGLALLSGEVSPDFRGTELIRTSDGGRTWTSVDRWSFAADAVPWRFFSFDGVLIWLGGGNEHIWRSDNGGADWTLEHSSDRSHFVRGFAVPGPAVGAVLVAWTSVPSRGTPRISNYLPRGGRGLPETAPTQPVVTEEEQPPVAQEQPLERTPEQIVTETVTATGYGADGRPVGVRSTFSPTHNPIHLWIGLDDPPLGETIYATWYYLGVEEPHAIGTVEAEIVEGTDHFESSYELVEGRQWPEGEYRIDVLLGDEQVTTVTFEVVAD